jgi:hypothetical protein
MVVGMRVLRRHGTDAKWSAKLVEEYDIDDKHHKQAITNLINDLASLAVVRNYYIDLETLLKLYDKHIGEYK